MAGVWACYYLQMMEGSGLCSLEEGCLDTLGVAEYPEYRKLEAEYSVNFLHLKRKNKIKDSL